MSKLKEVNTQNPVEFRAHIEETNQLLRLTGNPLSNQEIDRIIELHCEKGLTLDECMEQILSG